MEVGWREQRWHGLRRRWDCLKMRQSLWVETELTVIGWRNGEISTPASDYRLPIPN